jgi:hypothetical protein
VLRWQKSRPFAECTWTLHVSLNLKKKLTHIFSHYPRLPELRRPSSFGEPRALAVHVVGAPVHAQVSGAPLRAPARQRVLAAPSPAQATHAQAARARRCPLPCPGHPHSPEPLRLWSASSPCAARLPRASAVDLNKSTAASVVAISDSDEPRAGRRSWWRLARAEQHHRIPGSSRGRWSWGLAGGGPAGGRDEKLVSSANFFYFLSALTCGTSPS